MADLLLSALIPAVLRKAADSLFQRIGEMWGINDQREKLHNMLLEIQAVLPDAEEQGNSNIAVKSWLEKLKSAAYDADDLLDEFFYEELHQDAVRRGHKVVNVSSFFTLESHPLLCCNMSGKLKKVVGRVDGLVVQMRSFGFVHGRSQQVANRIRTDSLVIESKVVGRDEDKEKIVRLLLEGCESDDLKVIPVVGMGGLGKTTLAQLVYNDPRVKEYFNLTLWVCVSEEFNIGHHIKSIIELVQGECNIPIDNMELLQRRLRQVLSGKRYVLVLDDVWNEDVVKWERLRDLLNCGDSGSVVVVTTRSGRAATIMGTVESYNLGCLGEDDSWSLFHKRAFSKGVNECQEMIQVGRKMVQNCRGLPLAIITLGSLMSCKFEMREFSNYEITSLPEAISTLYLLQTLRFIRCFNLKNLPEGMRYMRNLRHLYIEHCYNLRSMPEGLGQLSCLQVLTTYIISTDAGNSIRELNNLNNLHGQLHLYNIGKIKHIVDVTEANLIAKQNLDDLALCWGMPMDHRRVDFNLPKSNALEVMHCDHLEVLDALKPCNKLKVLKIEEYRGDKLPVWMREYQMLENLIEMYIIECRECSEIPPVEKLPFLRILKLKHLDKLRYLCNRESTSAEGGEDARVAFPSLKYMKLSEMPELCSWCEGEVGNKSSLAFFKLETLKVHNCPQLTVMPIVPLLMRMSVKGNKILSYIATELTTLNDLSLESHDGTESLSFQPWESLNELRLEKYNNIVPIGANEGEVSITTKCRTLFLIGSNIPWNLSLWFWKCFTFLDFLFIKKCESIIYWPEEEFRSLNCLREIRLIDCPNFLGSQLQSPVGKSTIEVLLPILQDLIIMRCPNLVEIPKCSTSIKVLNIWECPKLQFLPEWLGSMVALKYLRITECESLNSLPRSIGGLASLDMLYIIDCPNLAYLPEGMEGLKALEQFRIVECPKIRVLPEGLLQQLKNLNQLWIKGCPHLERHFRKYGKYRHLISNIQLTKFGEERRSNIQRISHCRFHRAKSLAFQHDPKPIYHNCRMRFSECFTIW